MKLLSLIIILFSSCFALAYSDFIGMGYTSCFTCHMNAAGGGALNDYGRSLFAAEIASKPFWNSKIEDEALGEQSGFLGSQPLPWWVRPGYKYRWLQVDIEPGAKHSQSYKYQMQSDIYLAFFADQDQDYALVLSAGTIKEETLNVYGIKSYNGQGLISREHYLRVKVLESGWLYLGLMDKVFGIRHPDHTAVNRASLNLGQLDQVQAVKFHYVHEGGEGFLQFYSGNPQHAENDQYAGGVLHYESEPWEKNRMGLSLLTERNDAESRNRVSLFAKMGIGEGNALQLEVGRKQSSPQLAETITGSYFFALGTMKLLRGVFFQSQGEYEKADISASGVENFRWSLGFLYFPMQRVELRLGAVTTRTVNTTSVEDDSWAVQSQLHLSL